VSAERTLAAPGIRARGSRLLLFALPFPAMAFFQAPAMDHVRRDFSANRLLLARHRPSDEQRLEFGRAIAINQPLFRTEHAAAHVPVITVFSNAFEFELELHTRSDDLTPKDFFYGPGVMKTLEQHAGELPPWLLRIGIAYADGRKATSFDAWAEREAADRLVMQHYGGGGGGRRWQHRYRIRPLPPAGLVTLVVEWPAAGVAETRVSIDSAPLLEAAAGIQATWPTDPPEPPAESADVEAVFLAHVLETLGPSMLAVSGLRTRGARLAGQYPETSLVVDYDDLDHHSTGHEKRFLLWQGPDHLDLAGLELVRAAETVRARILQP
jgi:hypothetical protein